MESYKEKLWAEIIPGDTAEEIEQALSDYPFDEISRLMSVFGCEIKDLAHNIARAKGIKCQSKKTSIIGQSCAVILSPKKKTQNTLF